MKTRAIVLLLLLFLPGCVLRRTAHEKQSSLGTMHSFGLLYANERTNQTTLFSLGFFLSGSLQRTPVVHAVKQFDVNPLNVHPKVL
jgi:hypothetical protein